MVRMLKDMNSVYGFTFTFSMLTGDIELGSTQGNLLISIIMWVFILLPLQMAPD